MREAMVHRGPDGEGLWSRDGRGDVCLGHRRLSIVDLSPSGRQPMGNEDGTIWVTFNGEIYNHVELRAWLTARGHVFRSRCDTEVLVHLYEELGDDLVHRLVGMFAFAIWDERRQRLLLARDRMGIKPLYFVQSGTRFAFASEIKGLLELLPRREVDEIALGHYLTFVAVPPPRTMFTGVSKLAPASTMVVERDEVQPPQRFWDAITNRAQIDAGDVDWQAELRHRLERSIDRRMMSDVPVGVLLSGGVDSSTNVALMRQVVEGPIDTFSIGYGDDEFDEFTWARQIADSFGTRHHELRIASDDLWDLMPDIVHHQDEPIADPVCVPLWHISRLVKETGVTVVHVGEGADELFAGYPTYVTAHRLQTRVFNRLRRLPAPARRPLGPLGRALARHLPQYDIHGEALARAAVTDAHLWWGGAVAFYEQGFEQVTSAHFGAAVTAAPPAAVVAAIAEDAGRNGARGALDRLIYQDLRLRLPELLLMRVDKLTMASSVEARVPFLDHELVELAMAMPDDQKIRGEIGKVGLKHAVSDLLPHDLVWRPKQGFGAPVARWFRDELGERLGDRLAGSSINELGVLNPDRVQELVRLHRSGRADRSFQLWNLLNLSWWFDHWIAGAES